MSKRPNDDMPSILDGRLVRLVDGEVTAEERIQLESLLAGSAEARERRDEIRRLTHLLSEGLASEALPAPPALDLPERVRPGRGGGAGNLSGWRAAAAVAVLMGVGMTVQPVRAFITSGATRVIELLSPAEPEPAQVEPAPPPSGPSSVSFVPGGPVFALVVATSQAQGTLTITAVADAEVSAAVVEGAGESLLVLPRELRVSNASGSTAGYRVEVPTSLERVEVTVAGQTVTTIDPADGSGPWEISLAR